MCINCSESTFVCQTCGTILDPNWERLSPFYCTRRMLKDLVESSDSDCFVWFLKYKEKIVKIGFGSLEKLHNETAPNPRYCKFDSAFIYLCKDISERNIFATYAMGNIEGIVNRKAVPNEKYIGKMQLQFKNTISNYVRQHVIEDPDLIIGNARYWDIDRLREAGYVS